MAVGMVFVEVGEIDGWMGLPWLGREEEELAVCCTDGGRRGGGGCHDW